MTSCTLMVSVRDSPQQLFLCSQRLTIRQGWFTRHAAQKRLKFAYVCSRSQMCEDQLRFLWLRVQEADEEMREIRKSIHDDDASGTAIAILVYAKTDETSLMDDVVKRPWN